MNPTLKSTLMALATASLGLGATSGCSDKSSETPQAESSSGGEEPGGEGAAAGEASCSGDAHHEGSCGEGKCSADMKGGEEAPPAPEGGEAPPSP